MGVELFSYLNTFVRFILHILNYSSRALEDSFKIPCCGIESVGEGGGGARELSAQKSKARFQASYLS